MEDLKSDILCLKFVFELRRNPIQDVTWVVSLDVMFSTLEVLVV